MTSKQTKGGSIHPGEGLHPATKLTGTIQGTRFKVVLDDIKLQDKWLPNVLPLLQRDGVGKPLLVEGVTFFQFTCPAQATLEFQASSGELEIVGFWTNEPVVEQEA